MMPDTVSGPRLFHRLHVARTRVRVARAMAGLGYTTDEIESVIEAVDAPTIQAAANSCGPEVAEKVGALGDGTIINAIIEFFKSPEGQALIAALVKMLIAMLAGL